MGSEMPTSGAAYHSVTCSYSVSPSSPVGRWKLPSPARDDRKSLATFAWPVVVTARLARAMSGAGGVLLEVPP